MSPDSPGLLTDPDVTSGVQLDAEVEQIAELFLRFESRHLEEYQNALETLDHAAPEAARWRAEAKEAGYALQMARQQLHVTNQLHQQLIRSRSWRFTKPLRAISRLMQGDFETFSEGLWNQLKQRAERLPRQRVLARDKLFFALLESGRPLMKRSAAFRKWRAAYLSSPLPDQAGSTIARKDIATALGTLRFDACSTPLVSVIIPSYGNLQYTLAALRSIAHFPALGGTEVIVAEDASGDAEMTALRDVAGLIYLENQHNLGFLRSCNQAARHATGKYIFFLNSDAQVTQGAIDRLVEVFTTHSQCGIAGSMLIYPDGRLQEAGAIVWRDGSGMNVGRLDNPQNSEFNYLRETDYCSAAAILIERELFFEVGAFDERYAPAYYEDTDLAFAVRAAGRLVLFQPSSVVIHYEGLSHGTNLDGGIKANQLINQRKFRERWAGVLDRENFEAGSHLLEAKDRSRSKKIVLVIHDRIPEPDQDAGSRSITQFMDTLQAMDLNVKLWPIDLIYDEPYAAALQARGIEVFYSRTNQLEFADWYAQHAASIDYVLLSRPTIVAEVLPVLRREGAAKVLFYGHDIYHQRLASQLLVTPNDQALRRDYEFFSSLEKQLWTDVDAVYYPAASETATVNSHLQSLELDIPARTVPVYAYAHFPEPGLPLDQRHDILLVAGFRHAPNVDGALWFVEKIYPHILAACPRTRLHLVGSNPPPAITALASNLVVVTGFVSDSELSAHYGRCRVAIAPLRFGAGVKGKIVESLYFGLPMVTTAIGAEGFEQQSKALGVASSEADFAAMVAELLTDDMLWQQRSELAQQMAERYFSSTTLSDILKLDIAP